MIFWWSVAQGAVVLKTGDVCVSLQPAFANAIGDRNANLARPAFGLEIQITDAMATYTGFLLDDTGCLEDYPVFAEAEGGTITLTVYTRARLAGIDVVSWRGEDHEGPRSFTGTEFVLSTGSGIHFTTKSTVTSADQRWRNLSVLTDLFWTRPWNVSAEGRRRITPIQLQADPTVRPASCCRGTLRDRDDVLGNEPAGLWTGTDAPLRLRIGREVRKVLARLHERALTGWDCWSDRWLVKRCLR